MNRHIACIGARATPPAVLAWMETVGANIVRAGYRVVSGNAPGADQAWARGANTVSPKHVTLCLPWEDFEASAVVASTKERPGNVVRVLNLKTGDHYVQAVRATHPNFANLTMAEARLHARNAMVVEDVLLVLGYLDPAKPGGGGTGSAFRIAQRAGTCTLNVGDTFVRQAIEQRLANNLDLRGPRFVVEGTKKL